MHDAGKLAAKTLDYIGEFIKPEVTTEYLDLLCHNFIINNNAIPAPLNYKDFQNLLVFQLIIPYATGCK